MNRFAAAAITSTYYTVIFNFVCRGGADKCQWDSDKARELSVRVRVRDVCVYGRPAFREHRRRLKYHDLCSCTMSHETTVPSHAFTTL